MKRLLVLGALALMLCAHPAYASFSLIAHTAAGSADTTSVTTSGINTTGADLIVVAIAYYTNTGSEVCTITDSVGGNSNSWTTLTAHAASDGTSGQIAYTVPTHVGSGHTFTCDSGGPLVYPAIAVTAWSGAAGSPPKDQSSSAESSMDVTSIQPGSITPLQMNELLVTAVSHVETSSSVTIDNGFTISDDQHAVGGMSFGIAMAYIVETSIVAENPTWTAVASHDMTADIVSFTDGVSSHRMLTLGVGK